MTRLLLPAVAGVLVGWLAASPTWEVAAHRTGPVSVYVSGQPSYPSDSHYCRVTNDGYVRLVPRKPR